MPNQTTSGSSSQLCHRPLWRRRPRWSIVGGVAFGSAFTFGYLINSFFYCSALFSCSLSPYWLIALAIIGIGTGAVWGWLIGKVFGGLYRITRVD